MRALLLLVLSLILLTSCTAANIPKQYNYPDKSPLLTHMGKSTVALVAKTHEGKWRLYCSGVFVSKDTILTCSHCMEGLAELTDQTSPYHIDVNYFVESELVGIQEDPIRVHQGVSIKVDFDHDLALIATKGETPLHDTAELANNMPGIGSEVHVVGHPRGMYWRYTRGEVSQYRHTLPDDDRTASYMEITAPIDHGNSGCGVFSNDGKLIGILEAMHGQIALMGWAVDLPTVKRFLDPNNDVGK